MSQQRALMQLFVMSKMSDVYVLACLDMPIAGVQRIYQCRKPGSPNMALKHAGARFPYRFPPSKGFVENTIAGVGSIFRTVGAALDEIGALLQGPGAVTETVRPNLAWAPAKFDPATPPTKGQVASVPPLGRILSIKQIVMPTKGMDVFVAPNANVIGDVKIGSRSSIWYGAVLRGDVNGIEIGSNTNIQDNVIIHVAKHSIDGVPQPTIIGNNVTVGHCATVHAATVGDDCLIGMGSTLLDGSKVESGSIVAAGAVVPPKTVIPSGQVWAGSPAKFLRNLEQEEKEFIAKSASNISDLADVHRFENGKTFEELVVESRIEVDRYLASDPLNTIHQMFELDAQTLLATKSKK
ncbi:hypothetical protein CEUSTIGMA_g1559.t1 [Chlamydomonas eustigma]|uniref:UDP N-acetylglucosamine O-acyltransferase C-terminal domain-containing protein n=1 Tax=Chlamydomonas eustigma TaxID=1157962 RepID=A0A250WU70_9CHLO|nr:hypothetical protein CEUSTIGMA_g1559.t1 [Chlamydomonas eustigma]|eukprot:GAX74110.1 hypothetical protein CEUSTIGMA_g1559.t1 [Chlamydomonas eustigma]